jgi:hypothetical protein
MKLTHITFSAVLASIVLAPAALATGSPPSLADNMKAINLIFKAVQKATPDQLPGLAPQATQMAADFTAVLAQVPTAISNLPAAQQPAALVDFKSLIQKEIDLSKQLATDLKAANAADVAKELTDMGTIKTEGHSKYNP